MAVRATGLKNFKGDAYITKPELDDAIQAATGGETGLIDKGTGNLRSDLNPIHITSMERPNESGKNDDDKKDQDFSNIKFIGNCKVIYGDSGQITIRIGDNLNSSLYNGKDGISTTTVTSSKSGDSAGVPSADYSNVSAANGSASFQIFKGSAKITANSGTAQTTAAGATDGTNGNEVHFDDNANGKFKVYISKNGTEEVYVVGPITANGAYYGKLNGQGSNVTGIACSVTQFGTEPKSDKGATGYSGCVNFTITPSGIYADSTAFQFTKIEMYEGDSKVATWTNGSTNGTYFYLKQTDAPGAPAGADYTLTAATKSESGVTFLTTGATITATATGMKNIGYPAATGNKAHVAPNSGNEWFEAINDADTAHFTNWTTVKDTAMSYSKSGIALNAGKFENPQVVINGINYNGSGSTATSAKTDNKMWVYGSVATGSNITDNRWKSDFSEKADYANVDLTSDTTALQVYQGLLQYPSVNYSAYNKIAKATNPDYSKCTGDRYYYMKFKKLGSMSSGQIDVTSSASISSDISSGKLVFEVAKSANGTWYNICFHGPNNAIGTSDSAVDKSSQLKYTFSDGDATDYIWARITMKAGCTSKLSKVLLNGGTIE